MPFYDILMVGCQPKTEQGIKDLYGKLFGRKIDLFGAELRERFEVQMNSQLRGGLRDVQVDILKEITPWAEKYIYYRLQNDQLNTKHSETLSLLEMHFECDGEVGFNYPEDVVIGVPLNSRYVPVLLDWQYPHGGVHLFEINLEWLNLAHQRLQKVLPDSKLFMVTTFA